MEPIMGEEQKQEGGGANNNTKCGVFFSMVMNDLIGVARVLDDLNGFTASLWCL